MTTKLLERMNPILITWIFLSLLGVNPASTTETVTYLHTDMAGSPIAATDSAGNVFWRENYRPYGERTKNQPASAGNRQFFHDKPFDQDSGLSYFGARYYDPVVGRFMGVDSQGFDEKNLHSFNRYAYGNNNPYRYLDPNGRWPIDQHQSSILRVIRLKVPAERAALLRQQAIIDQNQSNAVQFKHALSIPGQTPLEAWVAANNFVRDEIRAARALYAASQNIEAMNRLGNAIHTMQDATSPAHEGFQMWDENWSLTREKREHYERESHTPSPTEINEIDTATRTAWELFKSNQPLPHEILPRP